MKKLLLSAAAMGVLIATPALAADLARPAPAPYYKAPPAPTIFSWSGCYIGADVGGGFLRDEDRETFRATGAPSPFSPYPTNVSSPEGVKAGGFVGCNYQFAGGFVLGAEGDAEWANIKGGTADFVGTGLPPDYYNTNIDFQASARGRIGYAFDRMLVYATGGAAWAHITEHDVVGATGASLNTSTTQPGWTVGGGLEYAFTDNLIARVEYRYSDFGTLSYSAAPVFPLFTENHKVTENAVRLGISYKFGGLPY